MEEWGGRGSVEEKGEGRGGEWEERGKGRQGRAAPLNILA